MSLISAAVPKIQLSASTGIHDGKAIVKQLLAGAQTVQACSVFYQKGVEEAATMIKFVEEWMERQNFKSIGEFRGLLNYKSIPNPEMYERSQFMKYYSSKEQ